ncbi:hypothetical protein cco25_09311, partial [Campylobacter coli 1148]
NIKNFIIKLNEQFTMFGYIFNLNIKENNYE